MTLVTRTDTECTQKEPFGFAILGRHIPVTLDACAPRFFQFSKSVDE